MHHVSLSYHLPLLLDWDLTVHYTPIIAFPYLSETPGSLISSTPRTFSSSSSTPEPTSLIDLSVIPARITIHAVIFLAVLQSSSPVCNY